GDQTLFFYSFFFQAEDGIRDYKVTGVQTCALPICALRQFLQIARREKIRLLEVVVVGVVAPFLRRKAPVARIRIGERRGLPGERSEERRVGKEGRCRVVPCR